MCQAPFTPKSWWHKFDTVECSKYYHTWVGRARERDRLKAVKEQDRLEREANKASGRWYVYTRPKRKGV